MKVFTIGVSGALGRLLARDLAERGDDVTVSTSGLDWPILGPPLLTDRAGIGRVSLGPAQPHDEIAREGSTPIVNAVQASVRSGPPGRAPRGPGDGD